MTPLFRPPIGQRVRAAALDAFALAERSELNEALAQTSILIGQRDELRERLLRAERECDELKGQLDRIAEKARALGDGSAASFGDPLYALDTIARRIGDLTLAKTSLVQGERGLLETYGKPGEPLADLVARLHREANAPRRRKAAR